MNQESTYPNFSPLSALSTFDTKLRADRMLCGGVQMKKKTRRKYSDEFKAEAVKLVTDQGYKTAEAARNLGILDGIRSSMSTGKRRLREGDCWQRAACPWV